MSRPFKSIILALLAGALPYGAASAQPAPLYPYQQDQPYAVQVAPNTYVIQRPAPTRSYPYVNNRRGIITTEPALQRFDRPHKPVDHKLVEELRRRTQSKDKVINTTKIVRDPPVVVEHKRYVDDPPRVIERHHVVEDGQPSAPPREVIEKRGRDEKRVIQADAEITIIGPDRMSIRLFRKRHAPKAEAPAQE